MPPYAFLIGYTFALSTGAFAQAGPATYTLDPNHTQPAFEVSHLGLSTYRGKFTRTEGTVRLDAAAGNGELQVRIDARSLQSGNVQLDGILAGEQFFDVERFPVLTYKSSRFLFEGGAPVAIEGELTLLETTRPVRLALRGFKCMKHPIFIWREVCGTDASATIRRSEFGMTRYLSSVGDEVNLLIPVEAFRD